MFVSRRATGYTIRAQKTDVLYRPDHICISLYFLYFVSHSIRNSGDPQFLHCVG